MTQADLEIIIQEGESYKIEFKESVDKSLIEEVCAFANASGGRVFIGISDDGKVTGTDMSNSARSRIQDTLRQIQPDLNTSLDVFSNIIVITVPEGKDKPYSCSKGFFLRVGPNSQKLGRNEIISFVQSEGRIRFDELIRPEAKVHAVLNTKAFYKYLDLSGITKVLPSEQILMNLGCSVNKDTQAAFTNAGVLFFSEDPMSYIPQAQVICALYKGTEKITVLDRKDLTGDIVSIIDEAILFLKKHLNLSYVIEEVRRKEILEIPEIAIREAIVNAVCHRDYFEKGANVMVEVFDDRVEISNPGALPHGMSVEDFGKRSMTRNPTIASLLHRIHYIEKMGTGINRMKATCKEAGIPEPEFIITGFFTILFRRKSVKSIGINIGNRIGINETQKKIVELMKQDNKITIARLAENVGIAKRNVESNISDLKKKGIIARIGSRKNGQWEVIKDEI
ncbi:MAG: hypothetical protein A2Y23_01865 [Clostridiales bacterium GWB2_37_7]|nr:MAG: hypothetical protein A2Y23_01865 [Clostridiales bacterium GWB2_37_7]